MAETKKPSEALSAAEKKAVRERARELKASQKKEKLEQDMFEKISEMPEAEQVIAKKVHEIVQEGAPQLTAKTWYGMPAWANEAGKVVLFFQGASKFDVRYSTIGFNEDAKLDEGSMWPTTWAVTTLTAADATKVKDLVARAVG